jgi:cell division protein FtsZ
LDGGEALAKADTVLVSLLGGPDLTLADVQQAMEPISRAAARANVIMGAATAEDQAGRLTITVVATAPQLSRRVPVPSGNRNAPGPRALGATAGRAAVVAPPPPPPKKPAAPKQEDLPLEGVSCGRFEKSEPTLVNGENLDVPTFIRRGVTLKR